jgi:uncharacterized metal-binding protein
MESVRDQLQQGVNEYPGKRINLNNFNYKNNLEFRRFMEKMREDEHNIFTKRKGNTLVNSTLIFMFNRNIRRYTHEGR